MLRETDNLYHVKRWLGLNVIISIVTVLLIIFLYEGVTEIEHEDEDKMLNEDDLLGFSNFSYTMQCNVCSKSKNLNTVVLVSSFPDKKVHRDIMRKTFSQDILLTLGYQRIFLLGLANANSDLNQEELVEENSQYKDMLQGNFLDSQGNSSLKHMMGLRWAANYCPKTEFVVKMDFDVVVDFYRIHILLKKMSTHKLLLAGHLITNFKPNRNPKSKTFVTMEQFPDAVFPNFLSGWLYVTNVRTIRILYKYAKYFKPLPVDDVYITGLVAAKARVTLIKASEFFANHYEYLECCVKETTLLCDYIIGPSGPDTLLLQDFFNYAQSCYTNKNCLPRGTANAVDKTCKLKN